MSFDYSKAAAIISNSGTPILDLLGYQYGVPSCLLDYSKTVLSMIPGNILGSMNSKIKDGKTNANNLVKDILSQIQLDTGMVEYDTNLGKFVWVSTSSAKGLETDLVAMLGGFDDFGKLLGFGAQAWIIGDAANEQFEAIKSCWDKFKSAEALQKGTSALASQLVGFDVLDPVTGEVVDQLFAPPPATQAASEVWDANIEDMQSAVSFVDACDKQIQNINEVLQARQKDPKNNPEPAFNGKLPNPFFDPDRPAGPDNPATLAEALGTTDLNVINNVFYDEERDDWVIVGEEEDTTTTISADASSIGPPVSKSGQYLFSRTGIYYDSYGGGLDYSGCITNIVNAIYFDEDGNPRPGLGVPETAVEWLLDFNPNLGGKGEPISWATFNQWANTIFNLDNINESRPLQEWYDDDHFLQMLIDQRNREVYDLSTMLTDYTSAYGEDSALTYNQRQTMYSKVSDHDYKIKRRKKQIEVHYVLNPDAVRGHVPINNLEDLDSGLIAVQKSLQEQILFRPNEVSGIVLPLCPTYIKSEVPQDAFTLDELSVPSIGVGGIINTDKSYTGTSGTVLSLNTSITDNGLVAIYNFLDADLVQPDSEKYYVINCTTSSSSEKPAQLVASSIESTFPSGVGLPYFRGMCNLFSGIDGDGNTKAPTYDDDDVLLRSPYRPYSYARIQPGWDDMDSLLYKNSGATIEFWCHVPSLATSAGPGWNLDSSLSSLHRVVLGCENRGGTLESTDPNMVIGPTRGTATVRGMVMGFTVDQRITASTTPSNDPENGQNIDVMSFHMSPTQSINTSAVTFVAASANTSYCEDDTTGPQNFYGLQVDALAATEGASCIADVSSGFQLITITINYGSDEVNLYLNGTLHHSQTVESVFGYPGPPNLPSPVDISSFSYSALYQDLPLNPPLYPPNSLGQRDFWYYDGPKIGSISNTPPITPWIIGGGYTDGMTQGIANDNTVYGMNFMGGEWGGIKSGLHGFLGSFKLYNRGLLASEVEKNYNAQQGFFKNLLT